MKSVKRKVIGPQRKDNKVPLPIPKTAELFEGVSDEDSRRIDAHCTERRYARDGIIFSEDDPSDALYILREGLVKLISLSERGTETILHILSPGDVFGELLVSERTRVFSAIVIQDVLVVVISRAACLDLLSTVPTFAHNLIRLLSRRVATMGKGMAESSRTWSYHRLAKELLHLAEKYGEETPTGTLIKLRLTHEDLANLIGTSRETVTTQLNKFKRMALLNGEGRHLIVSKSRLTEFIESEEMRITHS